MNILKRLSSSIILVLSLSFNLFLIFWALELNNHVSSIISEVRKIKIETAQVRGCKNSLIELRKFQESSNTAFTEKFSENQEKFSELDEGVLRLDLKLQKFLETAGVEEERIKNIVSSMLDEYDERVRELIFEEDGRKKSVKEQAKIPYVDPYKRKE